MRIKLKVMLIIISIILFIQGLGFTLATSTWLKNFGYDANPASIHMARALGGAVIGIAVMTWLARNAGPSAAQNGLAVGLSIFFILEAVVDVRGIMAGTVQPAGGWVSVALG